MEAVVLQGEDLNLPDFFAGKVRGRKVQLVENGDSIVITPVRNVIAAAKGMLKGGNYSSEIFMQEKRIEKELENA
jgi:virulence-associated protein VagC